MALQLQIEKLKGLDNYKAWSMTVRAYLESEDLWSVVDNGPDNTEEVDSGIRAQIEWHYIQVGTLVAVAAEGQTRQIHHPVPYRDEAMPVYGQHTHSPWSVELLAHPAFAPLKQLQSLQIKQNIYKENPINRQ